MIPNLKRPVKKQTCLTTWGLSLRLHLTFFFSSLQQLPVITSNTIVRCRSCRTYINPFVTFLDQRRWKCNLCYRVNDGTKRSVGQVACSVHLIDLKLTLFFYFPSTRRVHVQPGHQVVRGASQETRGPQLHCGVHRLLRLHGKQPLSTRGQCSLIFPLNVQQLLNTLSEWRKRIFGEFIVTVRR